MSLSGRPRWVAVGTREELPPGSRRLVTVAGRSIGVFNVHGTYFAVRNRCPHQGGPLCQGVTTGLARAVARADDVPTVAWERDGEILRCPWHAWEFDMRTGQALFGDGWRVPVYRAYAAAPPDDSSAEVPPPAETYPTAVEGSVVYVELPA